MRAHTHRYIRRFHCEHSKSMGTMKGKIMKTKGSGPRGFGKTKNKFSINDDPFFNQGSNKKTKFNDEEDAMIDSDDSEADDEEAKGGEEESEFATETVVEKRKRMAKAYLERLQATAKREEGEDDDNEREFDIDGERDSLVARILQQEQLEESGRVRRVIASRVQKPGIADEFRVLVKQRRSVNAVALSEDDLKGYSASKDGTIIHWDVDSGKSEKYQRPSEQVLRSHGLKDPHGRARRHSKHVLALDVSSDGRYLASGGLDRHVHLWDTRTREHIQAFQGHRGPVSCLTFRQGTSELFSGSFDRTIKIWNAEDRAYITSLLGHQSEVLSIDCLRKERVLTVGRDQSMQLRKVSEQSQLIFRAPASSLECNCFISNDEFLTGSDDGSIALWGLLKKKPVHIVKNAHALMATDRNLDQNDSGRVPNGQIENGNHNPESYNCSSAQSWVSSVGVCRNSDLAASGAGNGSVRLWAVESESKAIRPLFDLPLIGFVNSLAFAKSGRFLVAAVGQEPRLGRWGHIPAAQNGVAVHSLNLS